VWGASASLLGLSGDVARADLTAVVDDRRPRDGARFGAENRRVRGFDSRRIFAHAKTAGYPYQAQLCHELSRRLGADWSPVRNGAGELTSVAEPLRRLFSKRRAAIVEELARSCAFAGRPKRSPPGSRPLM
jgi:hypothetical protein